MFDSLKTPWLVSAFKQQRLTRSHLLSPLMLWFCPEQHVPVSLSAPFKVLFLTHRLTCFSFHAGLEEIMFLFLLGVAFMLIKCTFND